MPDTYTSMLLIWYQTDQQADFCQIKVKDPNLVFWLLSGSDAEPRHDAMVDCYISDNSTQVYHSYPVLLLLVLGLSAEEGECEGALDVVVSVDGRRHRRDDP